MPYFRSIFAIYIFYCIAIMSCLYISKTFLLTDDIFFDYFSERLNENRIEQMILSEKRWFWLSYIFVPIWIIIKVSIVSACLWLGCFLFNKKSMYVCIFKITLVADMISILPTYIKTMWFIFFVDGYSLHDIQNFHLLSVLNCFDVTNLENYMIYPLQLLSVWELLYWILLGYGLSTILKEPLSEGIKIVLFSYGPALLLWVLFSIFQSVTLV